jgi:hypothetical protein
MEENKYLRPYERRTGQPPARLTVAYCLSPWRPDFSVSFCIEQERSAPETSQCQKFRNLRPAGSDACAASPPVSCRLKSSLTSSA